MNSAFWLSHVVHWPLNGCLSLLLGFYEVVAACACSTCRSHLTHSLDSACISCIVFTLQPLMAHLRSHYKPRPDKYVVRTVNREVDPAPSVRASRPATAPPQDRARSPSRCRDRPCQLATEVRNSSIASVATATDIERHCDDPRREIAKQSFGPRCMRHPDLGSRLQGANFAPFFKILANHRRSGRRLFTRVRMLRGQHVSIFKCFRQILCLLSIRRLLLPTNPVFRLSLAVVAEVSYSGAGQSCQWHRPAAAMSATSLLPA